MKSVFAIKEMKAAVLRRLCLIENYENYGNMFKESYPQRALATSGDVWTTNPQGTNVRYNDIYGACTLISAHAGTLATILYTIWGSF
jgi:hypothetical protein